MPVAVRPRPELLDDPGQLSHRRVDEPVTECLRSGGLLLGIAGPPLAVLRVRRQRLLFVHGEIAAGPRRGPRDRHVQVDSDAVATVSADLRCDGRAPVAALRAVAVIAKAQHERLPGFGDLADAPPGLRRLAPE